LFREPLPMCDELRRLPGKQKIVWRLVTPCLDGLERRRPIERPVDFSCRKLCRVPGEPTLLRNVLRIKRPAPPVVCPPRSADPQAGQRSCSRLRPVRWWRVASIRSASADGAPNPNLPHDERHTDDAQRDRQRPMHVHEKQTSQKCEDEAELQLQRVAIQRSPEQSKRGDQRNQAANRAHGPAQRKLGPRYIVKREPSYDVDQ